MKWLWRRKAELCEPRIRANSKLMELETAKEILAEIFLREELARRGEYLAGGARRKTMARDVLPG